MQFEGMEIERVMVIYAHPDDAEFGSSGTVAKWAREGVEVTYVLVTNGASGSSDPEMTREKLGAMRSKEQRNAADILGVKNVVELGFEDGYLYPTLEVRKAVAREIRKGRPQLIISQDPTSRWWHPSYINHPDHIAVGEVVLRSINPDASTRLMFPELWKEEQLEPHKPNLLLLFTFQDPDVFVDVTDTFDLKVKSLEAHVSQVSAFPVAEFIRERAKEIAKAAKEKGKGDFEYGECFKLFRLEEF